MIARDRGVVFDLDGVLVKSEHLWEAAWQRYAAGSRRRWTSDDTRRCQGKSVAEWAAYLAERSSGDAQDAEHRVIDDVIGAYRAGDVSLVAGAEALVASVTARVPVGLASSAPRAIIDIVMTSMGLGRYFAATVSTAEVPRGKPSPDVYAEVVRRLAVDPRRSVAVEDSSNGVRSAAAAGLLVIAIPSDAYPLAADSRALAHSVQGSLAEVEAEILTLLG